MAHIKKSLLVILMLTIVICSVEGLEKGQRLAAKKLSPLRQRSVVQYKRGLARQEAVTPYPTADELKPEVPFEEGNKPDEVYGPPDGVYGPPQADQLPSEEAPEEFASNPDAEEFQPAEVDYLTPAGEDQVSRLTSRRKISKKNVKSRLVEQQKALNSQRLVVAADQVFATSASVLPVTYTTQYQNYHFANQPLVYTAHYQVW